MAYRNPTTQIVLIKGCPLDRNYNNTFYFQNKALQENFFTKNYLNGGSIYTKSFYSAYNYQRYEDGEIFIEGRYDRMIGHNYICFKNFEDGKWYYGFIDDMEYINENTTRVSYTIDVMQTWYFDYTMTTTFVEREHTETDVVGEHIIPEGLEVGEMVCTRSNSYDIGDLTLVITYTPNYEKRVGIIDATKVLGGIDGVAVELTGINENMYSSFVGVPNMCFHYFLNLAVSDYNTKLRNVIDKLTIIEANILSIFAIPTKLITLTGYSWSSSVPEENKVIGYDPNYEGIAYGNYVWRITSTLIDNFELNQPARFEDVNGTYQPKNKKLYTSPYCSLVISNNNGDTNTYSWEESARRQTNGLKKMIFKVGFCFFNTPLMNLYPTDYRGLYEDFENNVPITEFIEPFWSVDSFAQWWATNKEVMALTTVKSVIMGVSSPIVAGASALNSYNAIHPKGTKGTKIKDAAVENSSMSGAMSTIGEISNSLMSVVKAINTPDSYQKGNYAPAYNRIKDKDGYTAYYMNCHTEIAESIDNYFTMFGYAIKKLKVPNIKNYEAKLRPHWNFVKTAGCHIMPTWETTDDVITGTRNSIPKEAEELINSIYDKGVTFWMHNGGELGDYTLDNSPTV